MLKLHNLSRVYQTEDVETSALNNVNIEIVQGEFVAIMGPSGCGKSTLLNTIGMLDSPSSGDYIFNGENVAGYAEKQLAVIRKQSIGFIFQNFNLIDELTVAENIMAILQLRKELNKKQREKHLTGLMAEFHIDHLHDSKGIALSGGERRRLEIARALAIEPKFVLLDEPFAGIDPIAVEDIQGIVARLKTKNIGILITDHNVQETLSITDRAYLMFEGSILKAGTAQELADDEMVRKVYLGKNFELRKKRNVDTINP